MKGYINTPINQSFYLEVGDGHQLYVETCGNPKGIPVLYLHGGPGGSVSEISRRFFDPKAYHVILFDQRGTGKSKPFLSLENNTVLASVADIERIRQHFQLDQWLVFGGSYGSTLALAYAVNFPDRVSGLILRGIFLGRHSDNQWLYQEGASYFYPQEHERFKTFIDQDQQDDLISAYYHRMIGPDLLLREQAMFEWSLWESAIVQLIPKPLKPEDLKITDADRSLGLLEAHYFYHRCFWQEDNYILNRASALKQIPIDIVHGRYDVDCRPSGAYDLKKACPHARLTIVEAAGHSPGDQPLFDALVSIMERIKLQEGKWIA